MNHVDLPFSPTDIYRFVRFGVVPGHEAKVSGYKRSQKQAPTGTRKACLGKTTAAAVAPVKRQKFRSDSVALSPPLTSFHLLSLVIHQVFIPYTNVFSRKTKPEAVISEHHCPTGEASALAKSIFIQAKVVSISKKYIEVDRNLCEVDGITESCVVEHEHPIECGAYKKAQANGTLEDGFNCMCLNGDDGPISSRNTTKVRYDYLIYVSIYLHAFHESLPTG